jgi:DNA-binding transcriptional ArsR family regulator
MTVFELRSRVDVSIDRIETALGDLKDAGLITVEKEGEQTRIYPHDRVVPSGETARERSLAEKIREKLPF